MQRLDEILSIPNLLSGGNLNKSRFDQIIREQIMASYLGDVAYLALPRPSSKLKDHYSRFELDMSKDLNGYLSFGIDMGDDSPKLISSYTLLISNPEISLGNAQSLIDRLHTFMDSDIYGEFDIERFFDPTSHDKSDLYRMGHTAFVLLMTSEPNTSLQEYFDLIKVLK